MADVLREVDTVAYSFVSPESYQGSWYGPCCLFLCRFSLALVFPQSLTVLVFLSPTIALVFLDLKSFKYLKIIRNIILNNKIV